MFGGGAAAVTFMPQERGQKQLKRRSAKRRRVIVAIFIASKILLKIKIFSFFCLLFYRLKNYGKIVYKTKNISFNR
jgi:hypothetical protein